MPDPDLSYLTRDPALVGMPIELARRASANLAREDATIGRVNAVAMQHPAPALASDTAPPVAPTQDAVPAEATAANPDLMARHAALTNAFANGIDPDAPARFINPRRRKELENEFRDVTSAVHQSALENAAQAHESFLQQKDIETANHVAGFLNGAQAIKAQPGTPEYQQQLLGHIAANPGVLDSVQGRSLVGLFAGEHDKAQRRNDVLAAAAARQEAKLPVNQPASEYVSQEAAAAAFPNTPLKQTATGGWVPVPTVVQPATVIADKNKKDVIAELKSIHKVTPSEFLNPLSVKYGTKSSKGEFVPDADGKTGGTIAQIDVGAKNPITMSAAEYARFRDALAPTVAATPDLRALAQKALADPNASEAHKIAARKILGQ